MPYSLFYRKTSKEAKTIKRNCEKKSSQQFPSRSYTVNPLHMKMGEIIAEPLKKNGFVFCLYFDVKKYSVEEGSLFLINYHLLL